jgi:hypothetical protein
MPPKQAHGKVAAGQFRARFFYVSSYDWVSTPGADARFEAKPNVSVGIESRERRRINSNR